MGNRLLSTAHIAKRWGITRRQVQRLAKAGAFPGAFRVGEGITSSWLIPLEDVENYEKQRGHQVSASKKEA